MSEAARQANMPMIDQVLFSRSGASNVFGKLTAEVPKVKIPEATHEALERLSREAGLSLSEFVRELLMVRAHGLDMVSKLHADRLRVVAGMGATGGDE